MFIAILVYRFDIYQYGHCHEQLKGEFFGVLFWLLGWLGSLPHCLVCFVFIAIVLSYWKLVLITPLPGKHPRYMDMGNIFSTKLQQNTEREQWACLLNYIVTL